MSHPAETIRRLAVALALDWTPADEGRRGRLSQPCSPFAAFVRIDGRRARLMGVQIHESDHRRPETTPPEITVSLDRPLDVLTRDVQRRLLDPYRHVNAPAALVRKRQHDARAAAVAAVEAEVETITGARFGRGVRRQREAVRFATRTESAPFATLRVAVSAPDRVTVEVEGLTPDAALAMLRALPTTATPAKP